MDPMGFLDRFHGVWSQHLTNKKWQLLELYIYNISKYVSMERFHGVWSQHLPKKLQMFNHISVYIS